MPIYKPSILENILSQSIQRCNYTSTLEWHQHFLQTTENLDSTLEQAALGGRYSINMSYAFSAGYQSAIQSLFQPCTRKLASLCITEKDGNHPKQIKSALFKHKTGWQLNGSKSFITGANDAEQLYIAATEPSLSEDDKSELTENTRPIIKMLSIPSNVSGVKIEPMPPLPFVPDISHGTATFEQVEIQTAQILEGDGYTQYIKPFRTHEDIHVLAAVIGFRIGEAINSNWSKNSIEAHLMLLSSLLSLPTNNLTSPTTHIVFAGCRAQFGSLIEQTDEEFKLNNPEGFNQWKRDKALLNVASKAHTVRTQRAWESISGRSG